MIVVGTVSVVSEARSSLPTKTFRLPRFVVTVLSAPPLTNMASLAGASTICAGAGTAAKSIAIAAPTQVSIGRPAGTGARRPRRRSRRPIEPTTSAHTLAAAAGSISGTAVTKVASEAES